MDPATEEVTTQETELSRGVDQQSLDHAWAWFSLHASQRLQMLNFWLIAVAFLVTAYAASVGKSHPGLPLAIAVGGAIMSFCFHRLERRTRSLVRFAEDALKQLEDGLAATSGVAEIRIIQRVNEARNKCDFSTYGRVILVMQWAVIVGFLGAAAYAATLL